jgi:putative CocE/NonD family hydrolase
VAQDVRGKFGSEGAWDPFVNEADDGYDTLEWIARQPWCDGNIGMWGESYYGYTQWAVAPLGHPSLKCIAPCTTAADIHGVWFFNGGAFCLQTMGVWSVQMDAVRYRNKFRLDPWSLPLASFDESTGPACAFYKDVLRHPGGSSFWERINVDHQYGRVKIPVLNLGGWYDVFLSGTLSDWTGVRKQSEDPHVTGRQWLFIAPADHDWNCEVSSKIGRLDIGEPLAAARNDILELFYDCWLKGKENGFAQSAPVRIYVMGENCWRMENEWPLARTQYTRYYLHGPGEAPSGNDGGRLDTDPPGDEPPSVFVYDPATPVGATVGRDLWSRSKNLESRRSIERRPDVLVFTASELADDMEITGPISMTLHAATTAADSDFTAALVDLFPGGYAHLVQEGIVRGRYRSGSPVASPIESGRVYEFTIDLWATSYVVKAGHRLRVEISSSNFDRYDRNLNTGEEIGAGVKMVRATQTVHHDTRHPSHITLPVIPH